MENYNILIQNGTDSVRFEPCETDTDLKAAFSDCHKINFVRKKATAIEINVITIYDEPIWI